MPDYEDPLTARLGSLAITIKQLECPEDYTDSDTDSDDGTDLANAEISCSDQGAIVTIAGPIIYMGELKEWLERLVLMHNTLSGEANLECVEGLLCVRLSMNKSGQIDVVVRITPDPIIQFHEFKFHYDQTYLPLLINDLQKILKAFAIKK